MSLIYDAFHVIQLPNIRVCSCESKQRYSGRASITEGSIHECSNKTIIYHHSGLTACTADGKSAWLQVSQLLCSLLRTAWQFLSAHFYHRKIGVKKKKKIQEILALPQQSNPWPVGSWLKNVVAEAPAWGSALLLFYRYHPSFVHPPAFIRWPSNKFRLDIQLVAGTSLNTWGVEWIHIMILPLAKICQAERRTSSGKKKIKIPPKSPRINLLKNIHKLIIWLQCANVKNKRPSPAV